MIRIEKFAFNMFYENTFVLWDEVSREAVVIDPGCSNPKEESILDGFIVKQGLKVKYLLNTHCHIDHILGNAFVKEKYKPEFLTSEEDVFLIDMMEIQAASFGLEVRKSPMPDRYLNESRDLMLSSIKIKPIFTPGHSPGGYCFYFEGESICITGDVLFHEGIGRTDLWGGDYEKLIHSIEEKLFLLPDDVVIYPGHGAKSTIGHEKKNNPFL